MWSELESVVCDVCKPTSSCDEAYYDLGIVCNVSKCRTSRQGIFQLSADAAIAASSESLTLRTPAREAVQEMIRIDKVGDVMASLIWVDSIRDRREDVMRRLSVKSEES